MPVSDQESREHEEQIHAAAAQRDQPRIGDRPRWTLATAPEAIQRDQNNR
jgi:hypothetical protein